MEQIKMNEWMDEWKSYIYYFQLLKYDEVNNSRSELGFWSPVPSNSLSTSRARIQIWSAKSRIVVCWTFPHCSAKHVLYLWSLPLHGRPSFSGLKYKLRIILDLRFLWWWLKSTIFWIGLARSLERAWHFTRTVTSACFLIGIIFDS
jgi:hypothetical protein